MQCWLSHIVMSGLVFDLLATGLLIPLYTSVSVVVVCVIMLITTVLATYMKQLNLARVAYVTGPAKTGHVGTNYTPSLYR